MFPLGLHMILSMQHYDNAEQCWIFYAIILEGIAKL